MATEKLLPQTAMDYRKRVCQAMNYISRNIDRELPLEEIAEAAAFSRYHFHRIFKVVVGETVAEFTRRLRVEMAANHLLSNPLKDITTVAMECGFSSSQNFAKAFRQHFDTTPSQYRKSKTGHTFRNHENALSLGGLYDPDTAFNRNSMRERSTAMEADVKQLPQQTVAYVRKMGPYGEETYEHAFSELARWAGPRGFLESGTVLSVYWDNPEITPPEKCRLDACVSVPEGTATEGQVALQTVEGGPYGVCSFEIGPDGFQQAWEEAFAWLIDSGYECNDMPCFELYHNDANEHPEGKWIVDICIPLKAAN